jgi:superfamily I DNA and/or RNA helicase
VPSKWLSWHYRSQDESLISFSNHHYYESRLSSFPAPPRSAERESRDGYGVSMVRVNGTFNRSGKGKELRTNRIEAEAIVAEIRRRFEAAQTDVPPADFEAPSLGVVTFNAHQRDFIENLLRDTGDERILNALDNDSEGLFVKNLENVQGDERDAILFSIAFSVNEKGFLPLDFGPLQRAGGERRLNVAVTRARRQVLLFASFDPSELRAEQTSSVGVKHLKSYLEMAASGSESLESDPRRTAIFDRHRDDIANELRMRGLAVKIDVGLSDFRVDLSIAPADALDRPLVAALLDELATDRIPVVVA